MFHGIASRNHGRPQLSIKAIVNDRGISSASSAIVPLKTAAAENGIGGEPSGEEVFEDDDLLLHQFASEAGDDLEMEVEEFDHKQLLISSPRVYYGDEETQDQVLANIPLHLSGISK